MNYWLTTHWPPYDGELADSVAPGVWIPEGREAAGNDLSPGDYVFIYHPRSGRTLIEILADGSTRLRSCQIGREGVVAIARATDSFHALPDSEPERYTDGTQIWWRWHTKLEILSTSGFISRRDLLSALGYKPTYNLRGFGDLHSGLKKLTLEQFEKIRSQFKSSVDLKSNDSNSPSHRGGSGESEEHRLLKEYVASNPSLVLKEPLVDTIKVERSFPTGDRADIVLRDQFGRIIGLEIELDIPPGDITGPLQAIKYRRMLEMVFGIRHGDGRAILVAHSIPADIRSICKTYEVECIAVEQADVQRWARSQI